MIYSKKSMRYARGSLMLKLGNVLIICRVTSVKYNVNHDNFPKNNF